MHEFYHPSRTRDHEDTLSVYRSRVTALTSAVMKMRAPGPEHGTGGPLKRYGRLQAAFAYLGAVRAARLASVSPESLTESDRAYLLSVLPS